MKKTLLILTISLFTSLFASAQTGVDINRSMRVVSWNGTRTLDTTRTYRIYVPAMYDGTTPIPVIYNFHGLTSTSAQQEGYGDFRKIADTANFIIVLPQGLKVSKLLNSNAFNVFYTMPEAQPDMTFVTQLMDTIEARYNVNKQRVYSTGMSNGGFMTYEMACQLSTRFTAIASVSGSMSPSHFNLCNPAHPMPVMEIHGTTDGVVKYNGTPGTFPLTFKHIDSLVSYWVKKNGCNSTPDNILGDTLPDDINQIDSTRAVHFVYSGGSAPVELYRIIGGSHSWPNPAIASKGVCRDFNASTEIWRFFNQHKSFTGINEITQNNLDFSVYPNPTDGQFTVSISNVFSNKISISVVDILGKEVYSFTNNNCSEVFNKQISLENTSSGIYFIKINTGTEIKTKKFIKE